MVKPLSKVIITLFLFAFSLLVNAGDNSYKKELSKSESLLEAAANVFKFKTTGIITVGASKGNLMELYKAMGIKNIIWIDADAKAAENIKTAPGKDISLQTYSFAVSDTSGQIYFKTDGTGKVVKDADAKAIKIESKKLDDFMKNIANRNDFNAMFLDVEGYELKILMGAHNTLNTINYIICEVDYKSNINDNVVQIDSFLTKRGFLRADTKSKNSRSGFALYVRM